MEEKIIEDIMSDIIIVNAEEQKLIFVLLQNRFPI